MGIVKKTWKKIKKSTKEITSGKWNKTILGSVLGGVGGALLGWGMDYQEQQMDKMKSDQEDALRDYEAQAQRERDRQTVTDDMTVGDVEANKKKKRSQLARAAGGAEMEAAGGTLLGASAAGTGKKNLGA